MLEDLKAKINFQRENLRRGAPRKQIMSGIRLGLVNGIVEEEPILAA